jgi:hypothetical protein
MSNPDTFFSDLLEAKGHEYVQTHGNYVDHTFGQPKRSRRLLKAAGGLTTALVLGVTFRPDAHHDAANAEPQTGTTSTSELVPADYGLSAANEQQLSATMVRGLLYDNYTHNAQTWAELGNVAECEAWVAKIVEISLGPVKFDCTI